MISYKEAKQMYLEGKTAHYIEKNFGFSRRKLEPRLKKDNLYIKPKFIWGNYNELFFNKIDSEEKAYWLGFMYADGYVSTTSRYIAELALAEFDKTHLEKFRDIICPNKQLNLKQKIYKGRMYFSYRLSILNKTIVSSLIDNGCIPNKSFIITFPYGKVPLTLYNHFIRGYFDGDGTVGLYNNESRIQIKISSGSIEFLNSLQNIFSEKVNNYSKVKISKSKKCTCYSLDKGGIKVTTNLLDYIYKDATIYLDRKFKKYTQIKELSRRLVQK